jgi:hypothetical protein
MSKLGKGRESLLLLEERVTVGGRDSNGADFA